MLKDTRQVYKHNKLFIKCRLNKSKAFPRVNTDLLLAVHADKLCLSVENMATVDADPNIPSKK